MCVYLCVWKYRCLYECVHASLSLCNLHTQNGHVRTSIDDCNLGTLLAIVGQATCGLIKAMLVGNMYFRSFQILSEISFIDSGR